MSRLCPVAVRIVKRGGLFVVVARGGRVVGEFADFDAAWSASLPYFSGRVQ